MPKCPWPRRSKKAHIYTAVDTKNRTNFRAPPDTSKFDPPQAPCHTTITIKRANAQLRCQALNSIFLLILNFNHQKAFFRKCSWQLPGCHFFKKVSESPAGKPNFSSAPPLVRAFKNHALAWVRRSLFQKPCCGPTPVAISAPARPEVIKLQWRIACAEELRRSRCEFVIRTLRVCHLHAANLSRRICHVDGADLSRACP